MRRHIEFFQETFTQKQNGGKSFRSPIWKRLFKIIQYFAVTEFNRWKNTHFEKKEPHSEKQRKNMKYIVVCPKITFQNQRQETKQQKPKYNGDTYICERMSSYYICTYLDIYIILYTYDFKQYRMNCESYTISS